MGLDESMWRCLRVGQRVVEYYDAGGVGPAMVLLHGGQCTGDDWDGVVDRLVQRHRVIVPDGFVHGLDAWSLWRLLDFLGIERACLVGHSAGGPVTRAMYRLAPGRVWGLVAVDASTFGELKLARKMSNDLFSPAAKAMYEQRREAMMKLRPHHQGDYPSTATIERRMEAYRREKMTVAERAASRPAGKMMGTIEAGVAPTPVAEAGKFIACPSLLIQTGRGKVGPEEAEKLVDLAGLQAERLAHVLIKEAGHWPWVEDPAGFLGILEGWVSAVRERGD